MRDKNTQPDLKAFAVTNNGDKSFFTEIGAAWKNTKGGYHIKLNANTFFLSLKPVGKLTHTDYEKITPVIESALEGVPDARIKVYIDGSEFEDWELRATWDDFRLGLKHGNEFEKIAIFGHKKWQETAAKLGAWFVSGETRFFGDSDLALIWLQE